MEYSCRRFLSVWVYQEQSFTEGGGCTHVHRHSPCPGTRSPAFTRVLAPLATGLNACSGNAPRVGGFHRAWAFSLSPCLSCAAAMALPSLAHSHPHCHPACQGNVLASKLPQLCTVDCAADHIQLKCSFLLPPLNLISEISFLVCFSRCP